VAWSIVAESPAVTPRASHAQKRALSTVSQFVLTRPADAGNRHGIVALGVTVVGPDRMRASGLDEQGLEEYYRQRNLLKARVTGEDVARAVMFFATRQRPTTGATIPVDGGLTDATPR
jgi:NAD(P)-dependent dehydrogenase (short-subunit alcohol dehydrogenase family)